MGAWGTGNFENDDALDWVTELESAEDFSSLQEALNPITESEGYLEAPDCSNALAAAEVIAALMRQDLIDDSIPEEAREFIEKHRGDLPDELKSQAISSTQKIIEDSELKDLWAETDEIDTWIKTQNQLLARLQNS